MTAPRHALGLSMTATRDGDALTITLTRECDADCLDIARFFRENSRIMALRLTVYEPAPIDRSLHWDWFAHEGARIP